MTADELRTESPEDIETCRRLEATPLRTHDEIDEAVAASEKRNAGRAWQENELRLAWGDR